MTTSALYFLRIAFATEVGQFSVTPVGIRPTILSFLHHSQFGSGFVPRGSLIIAGGESISSLSKTAVGKLQKVDEGHQSDFGKLSKTANIPNVVAFTLHIHGFLYLSRWFGDIRSFLFLFNDLLIRNF